MKNRSITIRLAADGKMRVAVFRGISHVVVPVVALVEGVIQASNAETPELVLASEFGTSPGSWNGRPVMLDHPKISGEPVSANIPSILEAYQLGVVFGARVEGKKLKMEAWLNPAMVEASKSDVIERFNNGKTVEVSVGVLVDADTATGEYNGTPYGAIWRNIIPDHLAMLPEGTIGACNIEMGCGAPRAASEIASDIVKKGESMTLKEKLVALVEKWNGRVADDGLSDGDVRSALGNALYSDVPAFLGVVSVFADSNAVVYCSAPEGEEKYYRRTYSLAADGVITLNNDVVEVIRIEEFKPVQEVQITNAAGSCGCNQEDKMKKVLIAKILAAKGSQFTADDAAYLETLSEARLTTLSASLEPKTEETVVPPVVVKEVKEVKEVKAEEITKEKYLAMFPEVAAIVEEHNAARAAKRVLLVAAMKDQKVYTEAEMNAMPLDALEKIVKISGKAQTTNVLDFSGAGTPRTAAVTNEDEVPEPPSLHNSIRAARGIAK